MRTIKSWAGRRAQGAAGDTGVELLRTGVDAEQVARRTGLPLATVQGVRSFYSLLTPGQPRVCTGTACSAARGFARATAPEVHCVGRCYDAPCELDDQPHPIPVKSLVPQPIALQRVLSGVAELDSGQRARLYGRPAPHRILELLQQSGLRGRGGAAFPTSAKWHAAASTPAKERYVVANGDEGDPGSYADRLLLERDPHAVLAGMNACAAAIGARHGVVYIRGEYPQAARAMRAAIESGRPYFTPGFEVRVHEGAGSYVCGEETALLRAIEGLRAEPSPKPPYPAEQGLFGMPTVVQNVETLAIIPHVMQSAVRPDTKIFSLSGALVSPCAVEAAFGTPLRTLLQDAGGGPPAGRRWKLALIGGPMGTVLPATAFDTPLSYSALPRMGHGGIVVLDDRVHARSLAEHLFAFAASESCGNCTPCRAGSARLHEQRDAAAMNRLLDTLEHGSLCGFGQGVPRPIRDLLAHFPDEIFGPAVASCA